MSTPEAVRTTVLVADDDALVRGVLRMALTRLGYTVCEASDLGQVDAIARERHPQLAILDINMPGGAVQSTLVTLRRYEPNVAALVLSGEAQPPADVLGPLCTFARKPIELDDFERIVRDLVEAQSAVEAS